MDLHLDIYTNGHASVTSHDLIQQQVMLSELIESGNHISKMLDTINALYSIRSAIQRYGCTESIQYLFGDNDLELSVEGIGEKIKDGLKAVWDKIMEWITAAINFFKKLFGINVKKKEAFEKQKEELKKNEHVINEKLVKEQEKKREQVYQPKFAKTSYVAKIIALIDAKGSIVEPDILKLALEDMTKIEDEFRGPISEKPTSTALLMSYCNVGIEILAIHSAMSSQLTNMQKNVNKIIKDVQNENKFKMGEASHRRNMSESDMPAEKYDQLMEIYPKLIRSAANISILAYNTVGRVVNPSNSALRELQSTLFNRATSVGKDADVAIKVGGEDPTIIDN